MTLGVVDLRDSSGEISCDDEVPSCPSDEEAEAQGVGETRQHPPIVPLSTPNLRLRRKTRRMEPPPSPTHHRRPVQPQHQLLDEMLRIEWNGGERIVLSTPAVRWRSLSAGQLAKEPAGNRQYRRRKSRSLDSSPVVNRPLPGIRSSWAVQIKSRQPKTEKKINTNSFRSRVGSQIVQQPAAVESKEHRFALARLSPLFGRKCPKPDGRSEPNTPNASPALGRRRNNSTAKNERRQSPIR